VFDRRHSERFSVAGAKLHFKTHHGDTVESEIADLTNSSVRFKIAHDPISEDIIEVGIDVPGFHLVRIRGRIIWKSDPAQENPAFAVMQFLPFGTDERYNSMGTRNQIKTIIEKHTQRNEPGGRITWG